MKETTNSPNCDRAADLIAFLYNEAEEHEGRDFELHLNDCFTCREEVASFGVVRGSIAAWRDEALAGFVSQPIATPRKSALAAFKQFFDLSPLWLKGATAFAALAFCVLAAMVFVKLQDKDVPVSEAVYTKQDVERMVKEALARQEPATPTVERPPETVAVLQSPKPKKPRNSGAAQFAKSRRPLSKAEREQLAADLRLLSTDDDATLHLLGDRINR